MSFWSGAVRQRVLRNSLLASATGLAIALTAGAAFATTSSPSGGGTISYNNGAAGTFYFDDPKYVLVTPVAGDTVVITGITKNNTGGGGLNEALNGGSDGNATGSWTMELHGNTLTGAPASGLDALIKTTNGNLTITTTGGAANIFNRGGLVGETATSGNLNMNIGADTFNTPGALQGITANSSGTLTLNSLANITVAGAGRGISATVTSGNGQMTLGSLNGGIKGAIAAASGTGIWASAAAQVGLTHNIILGSTGTINAATGIQITAGHFTVDNFGSLTGTTAALAETANSNTTLILESGSTLSGAVQFSNDVAGDFVRIKTGANITNATFAFSATATDGIILDGTGTDTFDVTKGTNYNTLNVAGGSWTLANLAAYTGATTVSSGGTLVANTNLTASSGVTVSSGGTLKGTGTLPTTTVNGTLAPGNSIGTINVAGNITFGAGSTYQVETSPTAADKTVATGTATLNSAATVNAVDTGGTYANGTKLTILTANGGVSGTFGTLTLTGSYTGARPSLTYDANNVYLSFVSLKLVPLLPVGYTRNQLAVASAIDANATLPAAFAALSILNGAPLAAAMDELSGEISTQAPQTAFALTNNFLATLIDPFNTQRSGLTAPVVKGALHLWGTAWGLDNQLGGKAPGYGSHDASNQGFGATVGLDYDVSDQTVIGGAISGGRSTFRLNNTNSRGSDNTIQLGFHIKYSDEAYYVAGAMGYANNAFKTDRGITTGGAANLHSSFSGDGFSGRAEAGLLAPWGLPVNPYAAIQFQNIRTPAYNETVTSGASAFALTVHNNSVTTVRSEFGFWANNQVTDTINLTGRMAWAHDNFDAINTTATFQNLTSTGFNVIGAYTAPNTLLMSGGAKVDLGNGLSLSAMATGQIAQNYMGVSGGLTLDKAF